MKKFYKIVTRKEYMGYIVGAANVIILVAFDSDGRLWAELGAALVIFSVFVVLPLVRKHGS